MKKISNLSSFVENKISEKLIFFPFENNKQIELVYFLYLKTKN